MQPCLMLLPVSNLFSRHQGPWVFGGGESKETFDLLTSSKSRIFEYFSFAFINALYLVGKKNKDT